MRKPIHSDHRSRARHERPKHRGEAKPRRPDALHVAGLAAVSALFQQAPERVERLFFLPDMGRAVGRFCQALGRARKPYRQVGAEELARIAGTAMHGGVVALAKPRRVIPFDPVEGATWAATVPLLVVLDGIGNPHNLGAIARTAAFLGIDRLVISDDPAQAGPSDAAYRVAEGGLEFVQIFRASALPATLQQLKPAYRVVGTALGRGRKPEALPRDRAIALVLGNEERGLSPATLHACDEVVTIPGSGWVQSLNVAATAAILMHALRAR
ncbi:MAG TPA: RNA methyltransferase [Alphaproteobacteria bacterium]|nr:RNA methyltransferase [Alphaproteobacteria bacterium]